jgi:hypothetical protein
MDQIYDRVNLSIYLLKMTGILILISYFAICVKFKILHIINPRRSIMLFGTTLGILNATILIIFGKNFYFMPFLTITFLFFIFFSKSNYIQNIKHLLGILTTFLTSTVIIFFSILTLFFHLAVEGII